MFRQSVSEGLQWYFLMPMFMSTMPAPIISPEQSIAATRAWLDTVIIEFTLCPFAKREREQDSIRFFADTNTAIEACLLTLIAECTGLDNGGHIATTLLIYPNAFADFDDYLDFLGLAEALLAAQGYEGVYQLASFHPDYCFDGAPQDDPANYTNRSPYPMLHLLRESGLEQAINSHPHPEQIPARNMGLTRELGLQKMQALLAACYR
jgi:hypothetical protein